MTKAPEGNLWSLPFVGIIRPMHAVLAWFVLLVALLTPMSLPAAELSLQEALLRTKPAVALVITEVAAEVTTYAAHRLNVDAAIIFADILLIIEPMGLDLEFAKGEGPVIHNPVRTPEDVKRLREVEDVGALSYVYDAIRITRRELRPDIPLIGFCGAPFTLASYVCEGGGSKNYINTKRLMYTDAGAWHALMSLIARALARYLNAQIEAGAQAVQIFDSWVGALSPDDYREYVLPHTREVIRNVTRGVPVIHFGTGTAGLLELMKEAGGDVIGLDWRVRLDEAWTRLGDYHRGPGWVKRGRQGHPLRRVRWRGRAPPHHRRPTRAQALRFSPWEAGLRHRASVLVFPPYSARVQG